MAYSIKTKTQKVLAWISLLSSPVFMCAAAYAQESLYDTLRAQPEKAPAQSVNVTKELLGNIAISLRAQDARTKAAILEYDVHYAMAGGGWSQHGAFVGSDGICSVPHLKNTTYIFRFFAGGYESVAKTVDIGALTEKQKIDFDFMNPRKVKEYGDSRKALTLEPVIVELSPAQGSIKAIVKDAVTNSPLEAVIVSVVEEKDMVGKDIVVASNEIGQWYAQKLRKLPPEEKTSVSLRKKGYLTRTIEFTRGNWQEDLGEIALTPLVSIEGVVLDVQGKAVTRAEVFLGNVREFENLAKGLKYVAPLRALTDENGKFVFEDIEAGSYKILYGPAPEDQQKMAFSPGEHLTLTLTRTVHK